MAGWHHDSAAWKPKACVVCAAKFVPKSGANKFCSTACRGKWKYITGSVTTTAQYEKISGNWERYLSRLLYYGGRKRDRLTRKDLMRQLEKQNYRCALTGRVLTCVLARGVLCSTNASVDRVVAGGAYTPDNIQLVCRAVNMWRGNTPVTEFVDWCRAVVNYHDHTTPVERGEKEQGHDEIA